MRRTILLGGVLPFVSAFLGGVLAFSVAIPTFVEAQEARIRAEQFTIVGDNGADRIGLRTGPGIAAAVQVHDADGQLRASMATGAGQVGGTVPEIVGVVIFATDGTPVAGLTSGPFPVVGGPLANRLFLADFQGVPRLVLRVGEDGEPAIRLLDADGNVIWSAP